MFCKVQMECPTGCCCMDRSALHVWALTKTIATAIYLVFFFDLFIRDFYYTPYFFRAAYPILSVQLFVDIAFQIMLLVAYRHKTEGKLLSYVMYTKVLWGIALALGVPYIICYFYEVQDYMSGQTPNLDKLLVSYIIFMFVGAIMQSTVCHKFITDPEGTSQLSPVFGLNFYVKVGEASNDEETKEDDDDVEEIVCEKDENEAKKKLTE